jgi:asparagine synthase (glutamine-hydrolysing)
MELPELGIAPTGDFPYRRALLEEARKAYPLDPFRQAMYCDQHAFIVSLLDRNDRMTMGASIECRVPFLDYRLVEGLASRPTHELWSRGRGKVIVRDSVGSRLPEMVQSHKKWGFSVPWVRYLRQHSAMREVVEGLGRAEVVRSSPLDPRRVSQLSRDFLDGDDRRLSLIRQVAMIVLWHQAWESRGYRL